jgi:hypothetical protein
MEKGIRGEGDQGIRERKEGNTRPIRTGELNELLRLHFQPIYQVICLGSYSLI